MARRRAAAAPERRENVTPPSSSGLDSPAVRQDLDHDWLVVGSGFGGSVSALRLAEKGYRVGVIEAGRRITDDDMPRSTWDVRRYFWAPQLGMRGIFRLTLFRDVAVVSGAGVGGGSLGYANTLYRAPERFYRDPQWAGIEDWATALAPALRHRRADARRRHRHGRRPRRPAPARVRPRDRRGPDVREDARRRLLRHAGGDGGRPVLRRRGARAHRLHRLRPLHGRLPAQRQEHAAEELPLAGGARRGDDHARAHGRRHPAARRARRLGRLRGHDGAHRRLAAPRPPRPHHARRRPRRRPARDEQAAGPRAGCPARSRASRAGSASSSGRTRRRSSPSRCPRARRT